MPIEIEPQRIATVAAEAAAAGALGILGAVARVASVRDEKPMLRKSLFFRLIGDASLGMGMWLLLNALGFTGWWVFVAAWAGGALGYAAVHDIFLRAVNSRTGAS